MTSEDEEFSRFFDDHFPSLRRFLECLLGGGRGLAEEVAQESFMRLYRGAGLGSFPEGEARFWLFRVARNLALNEIERGRTRRRLLGRVVEVLSPRAANPEREYEAAERGRIVTEMLKSLTEPQRAALLLREQEGMSYREIAEVLGVSESKVKIDLFRARSALRESWESAQGRAAKAAGWSGRTDCL